MSIYGDKESVDEELVEVLNPICVAFISSLWSDS